MTSLRSCPPTGGAFWVGGGNLLWGEEFVLRSDDGGRTWREVTQPGPRGGTVSAFLPDPRNRDVVLAAIWASVQGTGDGGISWAPALELAHGGRRVYAFAMTDTVVVAVSDEWLSDWVPGVLGVYTAPAVQGPWTPMPTPPEAAAGYSVMVDRDGQLVIGTMRGVWLVRD